MPVFFVRFAATALAATAAMAFYYSGQPGILPLPSSTTPDLAVATAMPPVVRVQFFGDIMLDRNVAKAMGRRGLEYIFEHVSDTGFLGSADLTVANLEGPFAWRRVSTSKSIAFRFDPKYALELKKFGFSAFSLANNHSYDMGRANVKFTREVLASSSLGYFGDELKEGPEYTWFSSTTPRLAFIGVHNTYHAPDMKKVAAAIADAKQKVDFIIVNVHWGEEYKTHSNKKQQTLARTLVDLGADAIIGHHPHVIQEMEIYKDKPIFYSLGNFIFDQYFSPETQEGLSVGLVLEKGAVSSVFLFPFFSVKSQVDIMTGVRRAKFLEWFSKNSRLGDKKIINGNIEF